jgi:tetratricopeptide (TPR) repeat protein
MKIRNILFGAIVMFTAAASMAAETYKEAWAKGIKEYKARKYKESVVTLAEAVKLAKTPGEKYNSMCYQGYSLKNLRKYNEAVKVFEDLMKVEKLSAGQKNNVFSQYIHNVYWSKKYKELFAITDKTFADEKASKSMKTNCAFLSCLASGNLRKYDDKIKWAKKLQELNSKGVWYNRGFIYQAQALRAQKKYAEAEKMLSKDVVAKMHPHRQGEAFLERGHAKAAAKKYEEAVVEYAAVYELPKGSFGNKDMAIVYAIERFNSAGKLEAAEVWIERVDSIKSKYWKTRGLMRTAQILQKQGKLEESKKKWEECKKGGSWWKKNANKQIAVIDKKLKAK